jgi:DNA repair protein RadB
MEEEKEINSERVLASGSEITDEFLSGGYEKDIITTIYGPGSTGKTTYCILASISAVKHGKKVIFIDTEGGFSVIRFNQICDDPEVLKSIFILKPTSFQEQHKMVGRLNNMINEQVGLIIVDTIGMLYRVEYAKKQSIKDTNNMLSMQINLLTEISRKHNIPVLLTNQVYTDFDERGSIKVVGGDIITYASKCMIELKKAKGAVRGAILRKHRSLPEKEAAFRIVDKGFERLDS